MNKFPVKLLFLILVLALQNSIAQDTVYFRNKPFEVGKVSQIGLGIVLFMPDTFTHDQVMVKYRASKIHKIKYQSGRVDTLWGNAIYQNNANLFVNHQVIQAHTVDISLYELWRKEIRFQYAYYLKNKNLAICFPINARLKKEGNFTSRDGYGSLYEQGSVGVAARTFANQQSKFSFYAGLGATAGMSKYYPKDGYSNFSVVKNRYFINPFINLGYQHFLNNLMYLSINGLFGPIYYPYYRKLDITTFNLEVRLGIKLHSN